MHQQLDLPTSGRAGTTGTVQKQTFKGPLRWKQKIVLSILKNICFVINTAAILRSFGTATSYHYALIPEPIISPAIMLRPAPD